MIPISRRFYWLVIVLLAAASVPVVTHGIGRYRNEDCADPEAFRDALRIEGTLSAEQRAISSRSTRVQWTSGEVEGHGRPTFQIVRSFRARWLSERPSSLVEPQIEAERQNVDEIEVDGRTLPIRMVYDETGARKRLVAFLFVYAGEPVARPLVAQLRSGFSQLLHGTRPLTLFLISGGTAPWNLPKLEERARDWLAAAWRHYEATCQP
ncbi:MAG: hypothetical protein QNK03_19135 [Myxococcota bacterium]|nr:hypothetical protein [Myxococcota bacterium]